MKSLKNRLIKRQFRLIRSQPLPPSPNISSPARLRLGWPIKAWHLNGPMLNACGMMGLNQMELPAEMISVRLLGFTAFSQSEPIVFIYMRWLLSLVLCKGGGWFWVRLTCNIKDTRATLPCTHTHAHVCLYVYCVKILCLLICFV